jgi:hypothetical protein
MMTTPTKLSQIRDDLLARIGNSLADKIDELRRSTGMHQVAVVECRCGGCLELRFYWADELTGHRDPAVARQAAALAARGAGDGLGDYHLLVIDGDGLDAPAWFEFVRHDGSDLEPGLVEEAEQAWWAREVREHEQFMAQFRWMLALRLHLIEAEFDRVVEAAKRAGVEGRDWVGRALEDYMARPVPEAPPADAAATMGVLRGAALVEAFEMGVYLFHHSDEEDAYPDEFYGRVDALSRRTGAPPVWLVRRAILTALGDE